MKEIQETKRGVVFIGLSLLFFVLIKVEVD